MDEAQQRDVEALKHLAQSALDRFKTRLDWEWKARFGLWTALGAATAFTLGSDKWQPSWGHFRVIFLAMIALVLIYGFFFSWSVHMLHQKDIKIWTACEREIAKKLGDNVLDAVDEKTGANTWAIFLSIGQLLVTGLFAAALIFAFYVKAT